MKKINVLIAEDHALVAKLIQMLLESQKEIHLVGIASNGLEVMEYVKKNNIDIILLDVVMPGLDGISIIKEIAKKDSNIKTLVLSGHTEAWLIRQTIKAGASGYLTKFSDTKEIVEAISTVYRGGTYFCKTCLASIMRNMSDSENNYQKVQLSKQLTHRELEILKYIAKEYTTNEIADELSISVRTVETHRKNILQKLHVKSTVGLVITAMQANLIDDIVTKEASIH